MFFKPSNVGFISPKYLNSSDFRSLWVDRREARILILVFETFIMISSVALKRLLTLQILLFWHASSKKGEWYSLLLVCLFFSLQCSVMYSINTSEWHLVLVSGMVVFSPGLIYSLWLQQNVLAEPLECSQVMGSGNGLGLPNKDSTFRPGNWQQWYPPTLVWALPCYTY